MLEAKIVRALVSLDESVAGTLFHIRIFCR